MTAQPTTVEELENRVYRTARARFIAAKRLEARQVLLVRFIIFLALVQIIASICLLIGDNPYASLVSVLSITVSIFIAVVSNSEPVSKDVLHSHMLHKCGMELMSLYNKMHTLPNECKIEQCLKDYDDILINCAINHDQVDFDVARLLADKKEICRTLRLKACIKTHGAFLFYVFLATALCFIVYLLLPVVTS